MFSSKTLVIYKTIFYILLSLTSCGLFVFTIIRIAFTIQPRDNVRFSGFNGKSFYDQPVAELCFCGSVSLIFSITMLVVLATKTPRALISRNWFEVIANGILCFVWLGGAAACSALWMNLNYCSVFSQCRILQAMLAFAWFGWVFITINLVVSISILARSGQWDGHIYERAQKCVTVEEDSSYMEQKAGSEMNAVPWTYPQAETSRRSGTESLQLSSFSAFIPWLNSSYAGSRRTSFESPRRTREIQRKSSRLTLDISRV